MLSKEKTLHLRRLRALRDSLRRQVRDAGGTDRRDLTEDARAIDAAISAITHSGVLSTPWRDYALHLEQCRSCADDGCAACDPALELKFLAETTL